MKREIVAIKGSPRRGGFTSAMGDFFLEPFRNSSFTVHEVFVHDMRITPCTACGSCRENFSCIFEDDMTPLYPLLRDAALVVIAAPVYFSGVPGPLKLLIDRCQVLWELDLRSPDEIIAKEVFMLAAAGSDFPGTFEGAYFTLRHFFNTIGGALSRERTLYLSDTDRLDGVPGDVAQKVRQKGKEISGKLLNNS